MDPGAPSSLSPSLSPIQSTAILNVCCTLTRAPKPFHVAMHFGFPGSRRGQSSAFRMLIRKRRTPVEGRGPKQDWKREKSSCGAGLPASANRARCWETKGPPELAWMCMTMGGHLSAAKAMPKGAASTASIGNSKSSLKGGLHGSSVCLPHLLILPKTLISSARARFCSSLRSHCKSHSGFPNS